MKIGYDLDGVICPDLPKWLEKILNIVPYFYGLAFFFQQCICTPSSGSIIITGRSYREKWLTEKWLKLNNINNIILFSNVDRLERKCTDFTSAYHKAIQIVDFKIERFYESSDSQIEIIHDRLQTLNYNCEIRKG